MKSSYRAVLAVATICLVASSAPLQADQTDDRIESSAKKTHVYKTYLKDDSIKINAKDGVVTLTGTVSEPSHKSMAQDTVESLPGVVRVDNQLVVKDAHGNVSNDSSDNKTSDAWITTKVKSALLFHRSVSAIKTDVTVKEGIVTLQGVAPSQASKDLTTEYARDIEGVKEVRNEMSVGGTVDAKTGRTTGEKVDDASITAQVKLALLTHRSTSAVKTKVETRDGTVTLRGVARNTAEKDLVSKLVGDIDGVRNVNNEMTVEVAGDR